MNDKVVSAWKQALAGELDYLRRQLGELAEPLDERRFWLKPMEPANSVGHLILHLTGNLNHFAGARLGNTGYVRDKPREFNDPNPPSKAEALARLDEAIAVYRRVIESLTYEQLLAAPVDEHLGTTIAGAMLRLVSHFAVHRGQISYIARLVSR